MSGSIDALGEWWLPGNDALKVPGRLVWNSDSGGTLQLLGHLRPDQWSEQLLPDGTTQFVRARRADKSDLNYPYIHGQVSQKRFTLLDCFVTRRVESVGGEQTSENVHVNRLLESSEWFDADDDLCFDRMAIQIRHLTSWIGRSGITTEYPDIEGSGNEFSVLRAGKLQPLEIARTADSLSFVQVLEVEGDGLHERVTKQRWDLEISSFEVQPASEFIDVASDIQDLISIAAGKTADLEWTKFEHPKAPMRALSGVKIQTLRDEVIYRAMWSAKSEDLEPVKTTERYFSFDDFDGAAGVDRWLNVAQEYRTEIGRVMATRYSQSMYLEDKIMNICAALDSFDKVRRQTGGSDVYFVDRIAESVSFSSGLIPGLLPEDTNQWAKEVKNMRHDLAHHRDRFRSGATGVSHILVEQLYWLFITCILRLADAPQTTFDAISRHKNIRWLTGEVLQGSEDDFSS